MQFVSTRSKSAASQRLRLRVSSAEPKQVTQLCFGPAATGRWPRLQDWILKVNSSDLLFSLSFLDSCGQLSSPARALPSSCCRDFAFIRQCTSRKPHLMEKMVWPTIGQSVINHQFINFSSCCCITWEMQSQPKTCPQRKPRHHWWHHRNIHTIAPATQVSLGLCAYAKVFYRIYIIYSNMLTWTVQVSPRKAHSHQVSSWPALPLATEMTVFKTVKNLHNKSLEPQLSSVQMPKTARRAPCVGADVGWQREIDEGYPEDWYKEDVLQGEDEAYQHLGPKCVLNI